MINLTYSQNSMNLADHIDSLLNQYNAPNCPGASIALILNGKIIYKNSYGLANLEENIPITSETNFRLASVTKQFTASAILILIERGKLNLNDRLIDIFPEFPEYGKKISIKNLLNHTSGLIDYEDLIPETATIQVKDKDVLEMMMKQDTTYFEPGSKWQYSNTGYALLSLIVEKISKISFPQFLRKNILTPLEMNSTIAHVEGEDKINNRAYGYDSTDSGWLRHDQSITSAVLGDGGIYSSIEDLFKWDQSLYTSKILSDKFRLSAMTRGTLNNGEPIDYGYGWRLANYKDNEVIYHTGSTQGFRNIIYRIPSMEFTIIILTNRNTGGEFITKDLAERVVNIYLGENDSTY